MQNPWDVQAVHAYVNERRAAYRWREEPPCRKRKRGDALQKIMQRIASFLWL
jgi:hypothetical protein